MYTWVEEHRDQAAGKLLSVSRAEDANQSLCGRVGWSAGEQSCKRQGQSLCEGSGMVDDCSGASNIHEFDGKSIAVSQLCLVVANTIRSYHGIRQP